MKIFLLLFLTFSFLNTSAQEIKFSSMAGYALGETAKRKQIMLSTGFSLGVEFKLSTNFFIGFASGLSYLNFNYDNNLTQQVFNTKQFIDMVFSIKKYTYFSPVSSCYIEFGPAINYFYKDIIEIRGSNEFFKNNINNPGYNVSGFFRIAYKKIVSKFISFDVGICGQTDLFFNYKDELNRVKSKQSHLCLSIYRKLGP